MKALVYHGIGKKSWDDVPGPTIRDPHDLIVQVETTTICGTDLHILAGDVPAVTPGRILGHEAVGTVVEKGLAVTEVEIGDRVLVPAITSCGACAFCKMGMPSHCQSVGGIGWVFGHLIDGTQAEFVRVPFGGTSVHKIPAGLDDLDAIFLADIFPTGFEMGVRYGAVAPGDVVAVIGAGPVGLAAIATAQLYGPSQIIAIGRSRPRLDWALKFGANHAFSSTDPSWKDKVLELTGGLGCDVVIEAVGVPDTIENAFEIVRPGGHVANAGVHGKQFTMPIQDLWIQNITFTTGLVDGTSIPTLMRLVKAGKLDPRVVGTHEFPLANIMEAYQVFENSAEHNALKVVLRR